MNNNNFYYGYQMYWPHQPFGYPFQVPINYDPNIPYEQHLAQVKQEHQMNNIELKKPEPSLNQSIKQESGARREGEEAKSNRKIGEVEESDQYRPNQKKKRKGRSGGQKMYEKDQNRNIMPNTINKIFSYLRSKSKSLQTLNCLFKQIPSLQSNCTPQKYYIYQNFIKSRMNKFIMEDSVDTLFQIMDRQFTIFSEKEQIIFIKINIMLLQTYLRNPAFYLSLVNSPRVGKHKVKEYLTIIRRIQMKVQAQAVQFKQKYAEIYDMELC